jgi:hypothetical protein
LKKLRYKIDTRYDEVDLLVRCGQWCGAGTHPEDDHPMQKGESDSSKQPVGEEKQAGVK